MLLVCADADFPHPATQAQVVLHAQGCGGSDDLYRCDDRNDSQGWRCGRHLEPAVFAAFRLSAKLAHHGPVFGTMRWLVSSHPLTRYEFSTQMYPHYWFPKYMQSCRNYVLTQVISCRATMATNIPDFTRYMRSSRGVYWQAFMLPALNLLMSVFGTVNTSCAKVLYGEYIWSPLDLAARWDGPAGRCGAFFVGLCWVIGQIGTNLSASAISGANDLTNLFPKYMNIRRGVLLIAIVSGWVMVPWKIVHSASSLITFIAGLAVFLAPIAAILASDYWIVKKRNFDVPGLYRRMGRYRYRHGCNWRAAAAFLVAVVPLLPGLATQVNSSVTISVGMQHLYACSYLYGFLSGGVIYVVLSKVFPAQDTLLEAPIYDAVVTIDGVEFINDGVHNPLETNPDPKFVEMETKEVGAEEVVGR